MIANQPIINNISYNNIPKIEFRIEVPEPALNLYYKNNKPTISESNLLIYSLKTDISPFILSDFFTKQGYQIVKNAKVDTSLDIRSNLQKFIQFQYPSKEEAEWQKNKFLPQNNFFQIPLGRLRF